MSSSFTVKSIIFEFVLSRKCQNIMTWEGIQLLTHMKNQDPMSPHIANKQLCILELKLT